VEVTPYDAWHLACLIAGVDPESKGGDLRRTSPRLQEIARRLAGAPDDELDATWNAYVEGLDAAERAALEKGVLEADPSEAAPEEDVWGQPLVFVLPPVEPFPLDVYPPAAVRLIEAGARSIGCPPDLLALPALAVAGVAIGRSANLLLKDGYFVSASIYALCVGHPGDGKSPALGMVVSPLRDIDGEHFARWKSKRDAHQAALDAQKAARKSAKKPAPGRSGPDGNANATGVVFEPPPPASPVKSAPPVLRQIVIDDVTVERASAMMEENPRGLLKVLDEASSLMTSMNQYRGGRGSDRQWHMFAWAGKPITVDRKGDGDNNRVRVPHPFLGIVGNIVPEMVTALCDEQGRRDGFPDRFLFAYPDPVPKADWCEEGMPDDVAAGWADIVRRLYAREMRVDDRGREVPHVVRLSAEGKAAWKEMINAHRAEQRPSGFPPSFFGPWKKLEEYLGRIALILHMLDYAADPLRDPSRLPDVPAQVVRNAGRMLDYFKRHAARVYEAMRAKAGREEGTEETQRILRWIHRHQPESFTQRDLTRELGATFKARQAALEDAMRWLVARGCIRRGPEPQRTAGKRGRTPSPTYFVNPHLYQPQN
jgi:hypothetical protein